METAQAAAQAQSTAEQGLGGHRLEKGAASRPENKFDRDVGRHNSITRTLPEPGKTVTVGRMPIEAEPRPGGPILMLNIGVLPLGESTMPVGLAEMGFSANGELQMHPRPGKSFEIGRRNGEDITWTTLNDPSHVIRLRTGDIIRAGSELVRVHKIDERRQKVQLQFSKPNVARKRVWQQEQQFKEREAARAAELEEKSRQQRQVEARNEQRVARVAEASMRADRVRQTREQKKEREA